MPLVSSLCINCRLIYCVCVSHSIMSDSLWPFGQAPLSMGFFKLEYWGGLPFPPPRYLPNPGIEPMSPAFPPLQADPLPAEPSGKHGYTPNFPSSSWLMNSFIQLLKWRVYCCFQFLIAFNFKITCSYFHDSFFPDIWIFHILETEWVHNGPEAIWKASYLCSRSPIASDHRSVFWEQVYALYFPHLTAGGFTVSQDPHWPIKFMGEFYFSRHGRISIVVATWWLALGLLLQVYIGRREAERGVRELGQRLGFKCGPTAF